MGNRIDRFIDAMFKKKADRLAFATGSPVRIFTDDRERVILDKAVRTDQIEKLVLPILDPADTGRFGANGAGDFRYQSKYGVLQIVSRRTGADLTVDISRFDEESVKAIAEESSPAPAAPIRLGSQSIKPIPVQPEMSRPSAGAPRGDPQVDRILRVLVDEGGSDLHLSAGETPKMRKDGEIQDVPGFPHVLSGPEIEEWMLEIAPSRIRKEYLETHDADYAHEIAGVSRFRMNVFQDRIGTGGVVRTIPSKILTADQLNLPPAVRKLCELPKGLVCVTGPTGSGKSTTLAAMIDLINKTRKEHIITIEDPVEFVHKSQRCLINQREVHTNTQSFSRALRAALREDPDIVLVGEMRDLETVHIAIETAETGHLVFGTLHTNTAPSTVDRIIDQFPADRQAQIRVMLSETLRGIIAQTLCKKIGGGRIACLEILVVTNAIANMIREGKTFQIPSMMQTGKGIGMQTNIDAMMHLVKSGQVAPLEAYMKAVDQQMMKASLERAGIRLETPSSH